MLGPEKTEKSQSTLESRLVICLDTIFVHSWINLSGNVFGPVSFICNYGEEMSIKQHTIFTSVAES